MITYEQSKKGNFINHIWCKKCCVKHFTERKREEEWGRRRRRRHLTTELKKMEYSGNWKTKQHINLCEQVALEGKMDGHVVTQTTKWMYLNTVWHYRGHGRCRTSDRVPQCVHLCTIKLSGNYIDRRGRNEK